MFITNIDKPDPTFIVKKIVIALKISASLINNVLLYYKQKNFTFGFAFH